MHASERPKTPERLLFLKGLISGYDYSSEGHAHRTDEKMSRFVVHSIREAKRALFDIMNKAAENRPYVPLGDIKRIRDELDAFSDRIKSTVFEWDHGLALERIADKDYLTIQSLGRVRSGIKSLQLRLASPETGRNSGLLHSEIRQLDSHIKDLVSIIKERQRLLSPKKTPRGR
jgi:hypothetical protein